jgi:oligopeptide transport system substrate-binding protein
MPAPVTMSSMNKSHTRFLLAAALAACVVLSPGCRKHSGAVSNEKVLYGALGSKVRALDPGDIGDTLSSSVAAQIFECLYEYHYLKRPYELIPQLAESMPVISPDGLTYTIKLKKGVLFADDACFASGKGRELVASDFVYAWKRVANIKCLSTNWWIFEGRIVGLDDFHKYSETCASMAEVDYSRPVEGLQTPDKYTLVIKLTKPWPQIVYLLAHIPTAAVAKEAFDHYGDAIINHPVGTGPFVLKTWHRGSYMELVRNPSFRDEFYPSEGEPGDKEKGLLNDAGKKLPLVDRIVSVVVEEDPPRWFLFMNGKIDASGIPKDNFSQAISSNGVLDERMKKLNINLTTFRDPSTYWIGFNMEDPILGKNKPLRQALSCAVDRQKFIDMFSNGRGELAYGFMPPLMKTYDPNIKAIPGTQYDPQRARKLVAEAEKVYGGKLPRLKLAIPGTDTVMRQEGGWLMDCFHAVGLDVEADPMDWPTYQEKTKTKSAQMFMSGWVADYPDGENFLQVFYGKNASPGPNTFNYANPEFDRLFEQVAVMSETPQRDELYRKAERMVIEDCPGIFIVHGVAYVLRHDWATNYKPGIFNYGTSKFRNVDTEKRAAYKQLLRTVK